MGTLFGPDIIERRSTFDPELGSGMAQFEGFVQAGSFSHEELQLLAKHNITFRDVTGTIKPITIHIKPGEFPNSINPKSNGVIPVAILTTNTFDATSVDPLSITFGLGEATEVHRRGHIEDANGDGKPDLIFHFNTQATSITCGETSVFLAGKTLDGQEIRGADSIRTVGCK